MVFQGESGGQLQELLDVFRRRKWQVILPIAYLLAAGIAFAAIVPKKYECTTQVELRMLPGIAAKDSPSTIEADNAPSQLSSMQRIRLVVQELGWTDFLSLSGGEQNDFLQKIQKNLTIISPRRSGEKGSSFVTIEYLDVDPARAYEFIVALREDWTAKVVERDRDRINFEYKNLLDRQAEEQEVARRLQRELADVKATHDLSPTQPSPGQNQTREEDPLFDRLALRMEQLEAAELAIEQTNALVLDLEKSLAEIPDRVRKTETVEGLSFGEQIVELRLQRTELVRLRDESGYRPAHSKYKDIQRQLEEIDNSIADLESLVTEDEESTFFEPNPDYVELEKELSAARLAASKAVTEQRTLNDFIVRDREAVRNRQDVYRQVSELSELLAESEVKLRDIALKIQDKRLQMEFINGPSGDPFVITQQPVPPRRPSQPNPLLIIAFVLVLGVGLGFGGAALLEFTKSSFRGAADVGRAMAVPVLGAIGEMITADQRRRAKRRRMIIGVVSALFIVTMLWIAYGWAVEPRLLTPRVVAGIEGFRKLLM